MLPRWLRGFAALLLLPLGIGCSDSTEPVAVAASIQLNSSTLSVPDGETIRLTATVLDRNGSALAPLPPGMTIDWSTSDAGIASVTGGFVTGNRPGSAEIRASVGSASASATVQVMPVPKSLLLAAGNRQQGIAGEELGDSLNVRVVDRHGSGVAGVRVSWEVTSGKGTLAGEVGVTDAAGLARAAWRLGGVGGTQLVTVRSADISGAAAVFSATALGGPDAPSITGVTPAVLLPGELATVSGENLDLDLDGLVVTVAGVQAEVVAATGQHLTVRLPTRVALPCRLSSDVEVGVTSRGFTAIRQHPLRNGFERTLGVGEWLVLQGSAELACNELPPGRYLLSAFNANPTVGAAAPVELRGDAGAGAVLSHEPYGTGGVPGGARAPLVSTHSTAALEHGRILSMNREILRSLSPAFRERRRLAPSLSVGAAPVTGDTLTFRVPRTSAPPGQACTSFDVVRARVVYSGPRAVLFEDVAAPLARTMDAVYAGIGQEYETSMHSLLLENFGNPLALGTQLVNDQQVYMLFTRAVNDDNANVAGFVFSGDLFPRELCSSSDRAAIFYAMVPTVAGSGFGAGTAENWRWTMRSTIIHEVKHITSFAERLNRDAVTWEESWLEESTARISEELWARKVFGYQPGSGVTYAQSIYCEVRPEWPDCMGSPYVMLKHFGGLYSYLTALGSRTPLGPATATDGSFYGSGWSLVRWALDQGPLPEAEFLRALTQETQLSGVANLEARVGVTLDRMLPAWSLGMAVSGIAGFQPLDSRPSFPGWNVGNIFFNMNGEFPGSFPVPSPLSTGLGNSSFQHPAFSLRGGSTAVFEMSGAATRRAIQLRGSGGGDVSASVGLGILRVE